MKLHELSPGLAVRWHGYRAMVIRVESEQDPDAGQRLVVIRSYRMVGGGAVAELTARVIASSLRPDERRG